MMGFKDTVQSASKDNPLLKARVFYFFYDAVTKSLSRYLGLYYKHTLLLTPHQVAVLLSARSFSLLFGSPILGSIADKLNRFRNVLIGCLVAYLLTYAVIPFVEPVEGFNCQQHLKNRSLLERHFNDNQTSIVVKSNGRSHIVIHKYSSELKTDKFGNSKYEGNLMYDLFYTWPLDVYDYLETSKITKKIYVAILVITLVGEFFAAPSETFIDLYTLQSLGNAKNKFGHQIIPGLFGWLLISIGFAIATNNNVVLKDDFCHVGHTIHYSSYLYVMYFMIFICILVSLLLGFTRYPTSLAQDARFSACCNCKPLSVISELLQTPKYIGFAFAVVFCGVAVGVKQLYIYHYITELGGGLILLPVVTGIHCFSNFVALLFSPMLLEKSGNEKIILAALMLNGITFVVYSLIKKPWLVFLVEPFDGISNLLCWVAILTFVGCPPGVGAALQGIFHGLYRGLGITIGYFLVSVMILKYGYTVFFFGLGLTYFLVFFIYLSVLHLFPKNEDIAEEFSKYALLADEPCGFDSEDEVTLFQHEKYPTNHVDTSFLLTAS